MSMTDQFADLDRYGAPLTEPPQGLTPEKATQLVVQPCDVLHARRLIERWHSRLPTTQTGPWRFAFRASYDGITYGVALWNNPSARTLPGQWLELRRLAVSDDAPHCTASRMLGQMTRYFRNNHPEAERLISYQDIDVHTGTIYRAAGWVAGHESKPRQRDRSSTRPGGRLYRTSLNGSAPDVSGKVRWELDLA